VAIVVNKYLKAEIEDNLNIYLQDLKNEGYEPILKEWDLENDPAPPALKAYLRGLYLEEGSLQGAVFIGDLPIPIMKVKPGFDKSWVVATTDGYIAERYYMDLVGKEWTDEDGDYKLDQPDYESQWNALGNYTPEMLKRIIEDEDLDPIPEIWTSRIITSSLTGLFKRSEGKLVNAYLKKNHAYRTNDTLFQKQNLLYSIPKVLAEDNAFSNLNIKEAERVLSDNYTLEKPVPAPTTINEFFEPLRAKSYEMVSWLRHGMKTYIDLGVEELTSEILANTSVDILTAFVFPASCWIGHYIEPAYFSGSYLFNEKIFALGMPTSTLPLYGFPQISMISKFTSGNNLGLAFKKVIEIPDFERYPLSNRSFYHTLRITSSNSRYILGDGTIKLQLNKSITNEEPDKKENSIYNYIKEKKNAATEFDTIENINSFFEIAFNQQDNEMLEILIKKGANITAQDKDGNTLLHLAATNGAEDIIGLLIVSGLDVRAQNKFGQTPWDIAKGNNSDKSILNAAVKRAAIECKAIGCEEIEQIKFIIKNGGDVNSKAPANERRSIYQQQQQQTPLHIATELDNTEVVKFLIDNGANVNTKDNSGTTPLNNAIKNGNIEIVKLLIDNNSDINTKDYNKETPLHYAIKNGNVEIIKLLIDNNSDINAKNYTDRTPLHYAAQRDNIEMVKFLVSNGADVNARDKESTTPLHYAAQHDNIEIVKFLVDNGADVNARDIYNQNSWDIARDYENQKIMEILEKAGADT